MANRAPETPTTAEALAALNTALRTTPPSCAGDERFTSETADAAPLKAVCGACPLLPLCRDVALAAPTRIWGVLGGLVRRGELKAPRRST